MWIKPVLSASTFVRLQATDVAEDLVDLLIAECCAEGRHRTWLAVLDAVADEVVISLAIHELGPLAGGTAAVGMTPAASGCEQLCDIELPVFGCGGAGLLRANGNSRNRQRDGERQRQQRPEFPIRSHAGQTHPPETQSVPFEGGERSDAAPRTDRADGLFQAVNDQRAVVTRHALVDAAEGRRVIVRGHAAEA